MKMTKQQRERRKSLLYRLRQKGIRCATRQRVIFYPYRNDPDFLVEIRNLRVEFKFVVQFEMF